MHQFKHHLSALRLDSIPAVWTFGRKCQDTVGKLMLKLPTDFTAHMWLTLVHLSSVGRRPTSVTEHSVLELESGTIFQLTSDNRTCHSDVLDSH